MGDAELRGREEMRRHRHMLAVSLVSGAVSGVVGVSTTFPLELIRVRLQTQDARLEYRGFWDCLRKTVRGEGVRGLYKGMAAPLFGATLTKTVDFGLFGFFRSLFDDRLMLAGACSASVASLVLTPIDRAKIILQIQRTAAERARAEGRAVTVGAEERQKLYRGPADVWRDQGLRGMWRGQLITFYRELTYGCLYFPLFEALKARAGSARGTQQQQQLPFPVLMACGAMTGAAVWVAIFPLDVVKSRVQANRGPAISMVAVAHEHWRREGVRGFWKGLSAAIVRSVPAHGIVLATYSFLKSSLE
jgi:solute carrier family 25 carnitine/acylcarnitine transporter 20/29